MHELGYLNDDRALLDSPSKTTTRIICVAVGVASFSARLHSDLNCTLLSGGAHNIRAKIAGNDHRTLILVGKSQLTIFAASLPAFLKSCIFCRSFASEVRNSARDAMTSLSNSSPTVCPSSGGGEGELGA